MCHVATGARLENFGAKVHNKSKEVPDIPNGFVGDGHVSQISEHVIELSSAIDEVFQVH